jgi:hypothetical protein
MQVAHHMDHSKMETTKNIYGHLFAWHRGDPGRDEPSRQPPVYLPTIKQKKTAHNCAWPD